MIQKQEYQAILECILSEQIYPSAIAEYFKDKKFYRYYKDQERKKLNGSKFRSTYKI